MNTTISLAAQIPFPRQCCKCQNKPASTAGDNKEPRHKFYLLHRKTHSSAKRQFSGSPVRENPLAHYQQPAQFAHTKVLLRDVRDAQITMTQQPLTESESQSVSPLNKLVSHPLQLWQGSRAAPGVERAENSVGLVQKSATA